ncbi:signal peptide peptidase SppA [Humidesulfovibrio sp.]|uniref:signal peptide peptidase SppA n=1 Tax=Humidesulfovibrio sp. TaxID=2910988 RepID=UPI002D80CC77|nr:signal peptide peptidase SppA [Humidesulfovibrio sp.]
MARNPETSSAKFSEQHPLLFGVLLIILAVALFTGAMAFFRGVGGKSKPLSGDKIGLCKIEGMITDAREVTDFLAELRADESVKGVLLRIDSPGGSVAPSQELYQAVQELAKVKPVVVSMGTAAASGGYYAAAPATLIVANPGSITGSIGVRAEYVNVQGLLEKLGLKTDLMASGKMKAAGSPTQPLTPEQRAYLMALIMDLHQQFVADVASARGLPIEVVAKLADGRALTGRQALEVKLVDKLGGQELAMTTLREMVKLDAKAPVIEGPEKKLPLIPRLLGASLSTLVQALGQDARSAASTGPDGLSLQYRQ